MPPRRPAQDRSSLDPRQSTDGFPDSFECEFDMAIGCFVVKRTDPWGSPWRNQRLTADFGDLRMTSAARTSADWLVWVYRDAAPPGDVYDPQVFQGEKGRQGRLQDYVCWYPDPDGRRIEFLLYQLTSVRYRDSSPGQDGSAWLPPRLYND